MLSYCVSFTLYYNDCKYPIASEMWVVVLESHPSLVPSGQHQNKERDVTRAVRQFIVTGLFSVHSALVACCVFQAAPLSVPSGIKAVINTTGWRTIGRMLQSTSLYIPLFAWKTNTPSHPGRANMCWMVCGVPLRCVLVTLTFCLGVPRETERG